MDLSGDRQRVSEASDPKKNIYAVDVLAHLGDETGWVRDPHVVIQKDAAKIEPCSLIKMKT